jgi:hypothetical protein
MSTLTIVIFVAVPAQSRSSYSIHPANYCESGVSRHSSPYSPVGQGVPSAVNPNKVAGPFCDERV